MLPDSRFSQKVQPPNSTVSYPVLLTHIAQGPFEAKPTLFVLENGKVQSVTVTIKGIGAASPESKNDKPSS